MSIILSKEARILAALAAALAVVAGCGDETEPDVTESAPEPPGPAVISSYSGPGSNWSTELREDGSFAIARSPLAGAAADLSVSGTYTETAQGFLSMSIDASSGEDAPVRGNRIWAVEIPNYSMVLGPVSTSDDRFVAMVGGGVCPDTDISGNWINVRASLSSDALSAEGSYFGAFTYAISDNGTTLDSQFSLASGNPDQGTYDLGNGFCRGGIINSPSSDIYLATSGGSTAHVDAAADDGGMMILALPRTTLGAIDDLDGSYAGMLSDSAGQPGARVFPVVVNCTGGLCSGDYVTDVETGATAGESFTVDLSGSLNVPGPGLVTGEFRAGGSSGNLGCMADPGMLAGGERMISCAGQSLTRGYALMNLVLTSND
ncbi:MAG: hypothetical protein R3315_12765 [Woeseiaceae bacterium]|nr:hypothetical protein [Woeseiaceae bacterium]